MVREDDERIYSYLGEDCQQLAEWHLLPFSPIADCEGAVIIKLTSKCVVELSLSTIKHSEKKALQSKQRQIVRHAVTGSDRS